MKKIRGLLLALALVAAFGLRADAITVASTSPWLSMITEFVGGTQASVRPLAAWGENGNLVPLRRPPAGTLVIALDPKDAANYGVKAGRNNVSFMYQSLPIRPLARNSLFFDPSALPFLGQRLLTALSAADAENYPYYQRRLAEFQSRLESTLEVGRKLLPRIKVLDMTGTVGPWVRAALPTSQRPAPELFEAWSRGERFDVLDAKLAEAKANGWPVILDVWSLAVVRGKVLGAQKNVLIAPPKKEQDFFIYLHDIYLAIWSATRKQ